MSVKLRRVGLRNKETMLRKPAVATVYSANERLFLTLMRKHGPQSKAELTRATGLSAQSASVIVRRLHDAGLVAPLKAMRGKIGQPSKPFVLNPEGAYAIGVKIGRKTAEVVTANFVYDITKSTVLSFDYPTFEPLLAELIETVNAHIDEIPAAKQHDCGFGLAAPNNLESWETAIGAPEGDMADWAQRDMASELSTALGRPFFLINDASAACLAELNSGHHDRTASYIYFYIGTFVGGGIVMDGRLYSGARGNAAAIGSLPVEGRQDGQFTQLISAASLISLTDELASNGLPYELAFEHCDLPDAAEGIVQSWVKDAGLALAYAALSGQAFLDIHEVVVDGSLSQTIRTKLVQETNAALQFFDRRGLAEIQIKEGRAGFPARAQGAAILPLQMVFDSENAQTN